MKLTRHHQDIRLKASACALGMFDGVHVGHRMVLESAIRQARILSIPSVVLSFASHPQQLLAKTPTGLLSSLEERLALFKQLGFDHALILDFDADLRALSPQAFVDGILLEALGARHISVGYDYRFGKDKAGNGDILNAFGAEKGFDVTVIEPVRRMESDQIASSTLIRKLLTFGDIAGANQLLGRPYQLGGPVTTGYQRGRLLGFPTANLALDPKRIVPAIGAYGGLATFSDAPQKTYQAVCNIGLCPTFNDEAPVSRMEVHLLDYDGPEFYGQSVNFKFYERLRDEMAFDALDALVSQIEADVAQVRQNVTCYGDAFNACLYPEAGYSI